MRALGWITTVAVCALVAGPAAASEPAPAHIRTANAQFMRYLPPPPDPRPVCVVDSPVGPESEALGEKVVGRSAFSQTLALGLAEPAPVRDLGSRDHGTMVAIHAVGDDAGIWPGGRVVSVAASVGDDDISAEALPLCAPYRPGAVVFSAGVDQPPEHDGAMRPFLDALTGADTTIVAAAGNDPGPPIAPARMSGVLAVGAIGPADESCGYAEAPGMLAAQGCPTGDIAGEGDAQFVVEGTSFAAPQVAGLIAAIRSYAPGLPRAQAEAAVIDGSRPGGPGGMRIIDAEAAFRAAGLGALIKDRWSAPVVRFRRARTRTLELRLGPERGARVEIRPAWAGGAASGQRVVIDRGPRTRAVRVRLVGDGGRISAWRRVVVPKAPEVAAWHPLPIEVGPTQ